MTDAEADRTPLCPGAQPTWPQAVTIGVVGGTADAPRVQYLERPVPVSADLLALAEPVRPTEVFRFAAPCIDNRCRHFAESRCQLAAKIVEILPSDTAGLPACHIRHRCRWFQQEGRSACSRCPLVATHDANPSAAVQAAADPERLSAATSRELASSPPER